MVLVILIILLWQSRFLPSLLICKSEIIYFFCFLGYGQPFRLKFCFSYLLLNQIYRQILPKCGFIVKESSYSDYSELQFYRVVQVSICCLLEFEKLYVKAGLAFLGVFELSSFSHGIFFAQILNNLIKSQLLRELFPYYPTPLICFSAFLYFF